MLKIVETESKEYTLMQDLDSTVQLISKEKVAGTGAIGESEHSEPDGLKQLQNLHLRCRRVSIGTVLTENLEELRLVNCPSLQCVFSLSNTARSVLFPKLNNLHIQNCTMMVDIFSMEDISDEADFLQSLPNLKELQISNCGSIEVVLGLDQGLNPVELAQLTKLKLTSLEKLRCIWMKGIPGILSRRFQKLRELHVGQCQSLRNILTLSMAKLLVNLTTLTVENCNMVKEIVSVEEICVTKSKVMAETGVQEDEGEEISNDTIEFPRVKEVTLRNLPNLESFCATEGYTFNWPSLTKVFVTDCPRLETFTLTVPNGVGEEGESSSEEQSDHEE